MKINKATWMGMFIGGLYALIPALFLIFEGKFFYDYEGPIVIIFFPIFFTINIVNILSLPLYFSEIFNEKIFEIFSSIVNILLWILIGNFIGKLIQKIKFKGSHKKDEKKKN